MMDLSQVTLGDEIVHLHDGEHVCFLHDGEPADPLLVPFVRQGLERQEQCIFIGDDSAIERVTTLLQENGIEIEAERARSALKLWTGKEWGQAGGANCERQVQQVCECVQGAKDEGFKGIRFAIEVACIIGTDIRADQLERLEARLNTVFAPDFPARMICQYDRSRLGPDFILASLHTHPTVAIGRDLLPNAFYKAPLILKAPADAHVHANGSGQATAEEVDWMLSQLTRVRGAGREYHDGSEIKALLGGSNSDLTRSQSREKQLHRREAELVHFVETAAIGLHWVGADGTILWANMAEMQMLGYSPEEYIGRHIAEFHADRAVIDDILARLTCGETLHEYEARLRCKDGSVKTVLINSSVLWEDGRFVHTQCFTRDITDHKQAELMLAEATRQREALYKFVERRHEARSFQEMYDAALDAILSALRCDRASILLFDGAGVMRFVAWRGLSETYRQIVEGHSPWKVDTPDPQPICIGDVKASDIDGALKQIVLQEGVSALAFIPIVMNGRLAGKFMTYYDEPHSFLDEEIDLSLTIARQLSLGIQRKRAEEALRHSQKAEEARRIELETLMEAVPAIVWIAHDRECRRITGNRAGSELLRVPLGGNLSRTAPDKERPTAFEVYKNEQPVPDWELPVQKVARTGVAVRDEELELQFIDGTTVWIYGNVVPLSDEDGSVRGVIATFLDITDKKRAEEKLERTVAERTAQLRDTVAELEAFSYSIAHDMRAPLRAMTSFSRLLREDFSERLPDHGKDYARRISVSAERLDRLIQDVLNYSKISRAELPLESVDVDTLAREIIDSYPYWQDAGATILVQSPMPRVIGNTAALTQCLSNLLSNAVKFVKPGVSPHICVWSEDHGDWVRLWFEDNGIGISEEGRKRIFQMFQRLNASNEFEGTGIGLTIVRKAVEKMGGRVGVESVEGYGSRFWIELKRSD